jgi:hypothetical protein
MQYNIKNEMSTATLTCYDIMWLFHKSGSSSLASRNRDTAVYVGFVMDKVAVQQVFL